MKLKQIKLNKADKKPIKPLRVVTACFLGLLIFFAVFGLAFAFVDKLILKGSMSFFIIEHMINNQFGQIILRIGTTLFLPFFTHLAVWAILLAIVIPTALILVNVIFVKRINGNEILRAVCRMTVYFCLTVYIAAFSLSMVYADFSWHVWEQFAVSDDFNVDSFDSVQKAVKESKVLARQMIRAIMLEAREPGFDEALSEVDDDYYMEVAAILAVCFQIKDSVDSREEHYLRNKFYRAPKTLDDMIKAIREGSPFGWTLLSQADTVYHMQGADGVYNVKFVSEDGYHEAIYDKNGVLLTEKNDPDNMGTFNYAGPIGEPAMHAALDILPYYAYGNCPASPSSLDAKYDYQNNPDAQKHWRDINELTKVN